MPGGPAVDPGYQNGGGLTGDPQGQGDAMLRGSLVILEKKRRKKKKGRLEL